MGVSFIEKQFPVSKLSKESYKERKAVQSQTLTGLGKWWGRKPLVLVRAAILGCLMPVSEKPLKDMEIFLKIMSMDDSGLWQRYKQWAEKSDKYWQAREKELYSDFDKLGYDEKLKACVRPEQFTRPVNDHAWHEINHHLGTHAYTLQDLMRQLSEKRFGKNAIIGDCFCGGGSVPFEAARMGIKTMASDLNPLAGLLSKVALDISTLSEKESKDVEIFQRNVYDAVDINVQSLGIEHNELGDRADAYLYCIETACPECHTIVPLSPTWIIGQGSKTVGLLYRKNSNYEINIKMNATVFEMKDAKIGTIIDSALACPHCGVKTPISVLRHDRIGEDKKLILGLRKWGKNEFEYNEQDFFSERLYAVRYKKTDGKRYYRAPNERDRANEEKVRGIVAENIVTWQEQGLVPSMEIESGYNTDQVIRERGWTHWNHLFNARQLLLHALIQKYIFECASTPLQLLCGVLSIHRCW